MPTSEEAWKNLGTSWENLSSQPQEPGFVSGVTQQIKEEMGIPDNIPHAIGKAVVKKAVAALKTGEEEWAKLEPPKVPQESIWAKFRRAKGFLDDTIRLLTPPPTNTSSSVTLYEKPDPYPKEDVLEGEVIE